MKPAHEKYIPFKPLKNENRRWPDKVLKEAPVWCSVDLRDGNQALVEPMNLDEKLLLFKTLVETGFKEIEIGFPSASETEYEITRTLIKGGHIPDDVWIQVLVQAREHLIRKTFEAVRGAKNVIVHLYNSTSALQRKVVFKTDMQGVTDIAVQGAGLVYELARESAAQGMNVRFEYSPESFSGTETDFAVDICEQVMDALHASSENKVILNLPHTVEGCTPNCYADQIEYFCDHLKNRENAVISIHPHNDRGTGIAAAELAMLAGAERVEGTLFGNGERTGNLDIINAALNMYSQGIDPGLDFSNVIKLREIYEKTTKMRVHERHPYAGELVFTAFSGSHQDAIKKGMDYMLEQGGDYWEVPYLPIDPADIGREYEPVVRINSQSGKGGAAFIMQNYFGYKLPKAMHPEFGELVQRECDRIGKEMTAQDVFALFSREYLEVNYPYNLKTFRLLERSDDAEPVRFEGVLRWKHEDHEISGTGNGPIDAFFGALQEAGIKDYEFLFYDEHAISGGADSKAAAYIQMRSPDGKKVFGVGVDNNISIASIKGVICAINRTQPKKSS
ncbi:MAG TPA: 2-isopropylmalate synthase [Ruminococcaceae bacterium]|nr:2-isopropylmalate synthase [Oscillospiraceae bacterium]